MMYNLQAGNMDKVLSYSEKALALIGSQNQLDQCRSTPSKVVGCTMVDILKSHILEHIVAAKLIEGKYVESAKLVSTSKAAMTNSSLIHLYLWHNKYVQMINWN